MVILRNCLLISRNQESQSPQATVRFISPPFVELHVRLIALYRRHYEIIERFLVPGASEEVQVDRAIVQPILDDYAENDYECSGNIDRFDPVLLFPSFCASVSHRFHSHIVQLYHVILRFLDDETAAKFLAKPKVVEYLKG